MTEYTKQINKEFRVLTAFGMIFVICGHYGINAFTFGDFYPSIYDASMFGWNSNQYDYAALAS